MIQINNKPNPKLSENFPQDAYADITIVTSTRELRLVIAYLSLDSNYFAALSPDTKIVDLSFLPEEPLYETLKALYGAELIVNSIKELEAVYEIIDVLGVDDFKQNIENQVKLKPEIMETLEFLEFSFRTDLLKEEVIEIHLKNSLEFFESNKNYLQLNKISNETINALLNLFYDRTNQKNGSTKKWKNINNVLQNYFTRNNIKAVNYFQKYEIQNLKKVWEHFHHKMYFVQSEPTDSQIHNPMGVSMPLGEQTVKKPFHLNSMKSMTDSYSFNSQIENKRNKLWMLDKEMEQKDRTIKQLQEELEELKSTKPNAKYMAVTNLEEQDETLLHNIKKKKRINSGQFDQDLTTSEQAFDQFRKLPESKEYKTIAKLHHRNMKIYN